MAQVTKRAKDQYNPPTAKEISLSHATALETASESLVVHLTHTRTHTHTLTNLLADA